VIRLGLRNPKKKEEGKKKNIIVRIIMIIIAIPLHFLNPLPTYKYITSKEYSCVQGLLRECRSKREEMLFIGIQMEDQV